LIAGYYAAAIIPVTNAISSFVSVEHQGFKAAWTVDNSVSMEFEYNVYTGVTAIDDVVSSNIVLNRNLGNRIIFASGPAWPQKRRQYGFVDIDWVSGTCTPI